SFPGVVPLLPRPRRFSSLSGTGLGEAGVFRSVDFSYSAGGFGRAVDSPGAGRWAKGAVRASPPHCALGLSHLAVCVHYRGGGVHRALSDLRRPCVIMMQAATTAVWPFFFLEAWAGGEPQLQPGNAAQPSLPDLLPAQKRIHFVPLTTFLASKTQTP